MTRTGRVFAGVADKGLRLVVFVVVAVDGRFEMEALSENTVCLLLAVEGLVN